MKRRIRGHQCLYHQPTCTECHEVMSAWLFAWKDIKPVVLRYILILRVTKSETFNSCIAPPFRSLLNECNEVSDFVHNND